MAEFLRNTRTESSGVFQFVLRLVTASIVLAITAALTPGFAIGGIFPLLLSAVVISVLDYVISLAGFNASPFGRGVTGFLLATAIIYFTQFFVAGYSVTLLGAIIAALVYGLVDALIPGKAM